MLSSAFNTPLKTPTKQLSVTSKVIPLNDFSLVTPTPKRLAQKKINNDSYPTPAAFKNNDNIKNIPSTPSKIPSERKQNIRASLNSLHSGAVKLQKTSGHVNMEPIKNQDSSSLVAVYNEMEIGVVDENDTNALAQLEEKEGKKITELKNRIAQEVTRRKSAEDKLRDLELDLRDSEARLQPIQEYFVSQTKAMQNRLEDLTAQLKKEKNEKKYLEEQFAYFEDELQMTRSKLMNQQVALESDIIQTTCSWLVESCVHEVSLMMMQEEAVAAAITTAKTIVPSINSVELPHQQAIDDCHHESTPMIAKVIDEISLLTPPTDLAMSTVRKLRFQVERYREERNLLREFEDVEKDLNFKSVESLETKLKEYEEKLNISQSHINTLQDQVKILKQYEKVVEAIEAENYNLQTKLEKQRGNMEKMKIVETEKQHYVESLQSSLEKQKNNYDKTLSDLRIKMNDAVHQLGRKEKLIEEYSLKELVWKQQLQRFQELAENATGERDIAKANLNKAASDMNKLLQKLNNLENEKMEAEAYAREIKLQHDAAVHKANERIENLEKEQQILQNRLVKDKNSRKELENEMSTLKMELLDARERTKLLEKEREYFIKEQEKAETLKKETSEHRLKINHLETNIRQREFKIQDLESDIKKLRMEMEEDRGKSVKEKSSEIRLEGEVKRLQTELGEMTKFIRKFKEKADHRLSFLKEELIDRDQDIRSYLAIRNEILQNHESIEKIPELRNLLLVAQQLPASFKQK